MKIAFSGAHSVGKTTLVEYVSNKYNLPIVEEKARYFMNHGFPFEDLEKDIDLFINFQSAIFDLQIKEESHYNSFVSDRTLFDSVGYLQERLTKERYSNFEIFKKYYEKAVENYANYDLIFFIKIQLSMIEEDGFRNNNLLYLFTLQDLILRKYEELQIPVIEIDTDSLEERKSLVSFHIKRKKL